MHLPRRSICARSASRHCQVPGLFAFRTRCGPQEIVNEHSATIMHAPKTFHRLGGNLSHIFCTHCTGQNLPEERFDRLSRGKASKARACSAAFYFPLPQPRSRGVLRHLAWDRAMHGVLISACEVFELCFRRPRLLFSKCCIRCIARRPSRHEVLKGIRFCA